MDANSKRLQTSATDVLVDAYIRGLGLVTRIIELSEPEAQCDEAITAMWDEINQLLNAIAYRFEDVMEYDDAKRQHVDAQFVGSRMLLVRKNIERSVTEQKYEEVNSRR